METSTYPFQDHRLRVHVEDNGDKDFSRVDVQQYSQENWKTLATMTLPTAAPNNDQWLKILIKGTGNDMQFELTLNATVESVRPTVFEVDARENWQYGAEGEHRRGGIGIIDIRGSREVKVEYDFYRSGAYVRYDTSGYIQVASPGVFVGIND